jgi:hypothetical protein
MSHRKPRDQAEECPTIRPQSPPCRRADCGRLNPKNAPRYRFKVLPGAGYCVTSNGKAGKSFFEREVCASGRGTITEQVVENFWLHRPVLPGRIEARVGAFCKIPRSRESIVFIRPFPKPAPRLSSLRRQFENLSPLLVTRRSDMCVSVRIPADIPSLTTSIKPAIHKAMMRGEDDGGFRRR